MRSGPVLYVAAEGHAGLPGRVKAWIKRHGNRPDSLMFVLEPVDLFTPERIAALLEAIAALTRPPVLLVFDTLARCIPGADEDSAKDLGVAIAHVDRLRHELGCTVLLIHHTGKIGDLERGSSALRGAADTMIRIKGAGTLIEASCSKQKDAEPFMARHFELKAVEGTESCSLVPTFGVLAAEREAGNGKAEPILAALRTSPGMRHSEIRAATGIAGSTLSRHLKGLEDLHVITKGPDGRYYPATSGDMGTDG